MINIKLQRYDRQRSVETLKGILDGILADSTITTNEISQLIQWLQIHSHLRNEHPFNELHEIISHITADEVITEEELDELSEWCAQLCDDGSVMNKTTTHAIRRLHGILAGIAADNRVSDDEILGLRDWLDDYSFAAEIWPYAEVQQFVRDILRDGRISHEEQENLLALCNEFTEKLSTDPRDKDKDNIVPQMNIPMLQSFTAICDYNAPISFPNKCFCVTGKSPHYSRKELHAIIIKNQGTPIDNVSSRINYLIIGANSSPAWAYASYGRKIESIMQLRKSGHDAYILHELTFLEAANALPSK